MRRIWLIAFWALLSLSFKGYSQNKGDELDSLRKIEENGKDTVIYNSHYIRYTTLALLKDSTQTLPIDTTLKNFQLYNPLYQRHRPSIGLGSSGLAARELLFAPRKDIGFDAGFHSLDIYLLKQSDIQYFRARSPYTQLYYVNGQLKEQFFKVTHSQNIKPNWNFGANYFRIGSQGFYKNQQADHLNAAVFTWYESKNKRYNLLANGLFNTLKASENGAVINDSLFESNTLSREALRVRLSAAKDDRTRQIWRHKNVFIKQFYYLGRIDSLASDSADRKVLPTQRISHSISYSDNVYKFFKNEIDLEGAFPAVIPDSVALHRDSTTVKRLSNEFGYSFYLRGRAVSFIRNEMKLDLMLQHDLYNYYQNDYHTSFQNLTAKAGLGYRFSDRVNIEGNIEQIFQGRNIGDYLYEANTNFYLSRDLGRIVMGAYIQNKSPEELFTRSNYSFHQWNLDFKNTKIDNLSFLYDNQRFGLTAKAEYYLMLNYLYFQETTPRQVIPTQFDKSINLIKFSLDKNFDFRKFHLESSVVYQKTDFATILRTPEIYTYNSFYYASRWFKKLDINIGFDVWYNTPFKAPEYAINISQFYNDNAAVELPTYPLVDVWVKATLGRANLFLKYDYANQGFLSKGFYTVNHYPMQDALLKFGVRWNFYN